MEDAVATSINEQNRARSQAAFDARMREIDQRNATNQTMTGIAVAVGVALFASAVSGSQRPNAAPLCNRTGDNLLYVVAKEQSDLLGSNPNLFTPKMSTEGPLLVAAGQCHDLLVPVGKLWWLSFFKKGQSGVAELVRFSGDDDGKVSAARQSIRNLQFCRQAEHPKLRWSEPRRQGLP